MSASRYLTRLGETLNAMLDRLEADGFSRLRPSERRADLQLTRLPIIRDHIS